MGSLLASVFALVLPALAGSGPADRYDRLIDRHSRQRSLDPRLVKAVIDAESGFYERAVSPSGARGLMQLMPETGRLMGVPPERLFAPDDNLRAGTAYLAFLFRRLWATHRLAGPCCEQAPAWVVRRAVAGYHAGPRAMRRTARDWPPATRAYVAKVMRGRASPASALRIPAHRPSPVRPVEEVVALAGSRGEWSRKVVSTRETPALPPRRRVKPKTGG